MKMIQATAISPYDDCLDEPATVSRLPASSGRSFDLSRDPPAGRVVPTGECACDELG